MKKIFLPVILLFVLNSTIFPVTPATDIFYHITQDMNSFSTIFPLKEGSRGESEAVSMILKRLDSSEIKYTVYNLNESEDYPSSSVIIDTVFAGDSDDEIFLVFPLSGRISAFPESNAFSISEALFLAENINKVDLANTVHILFMGAEYGNGQEYPLGSREYLKLYYPKQNSAFFYFDISGIPDKIELFTAGTGNISPLWMVEKGLDALKDSHILFSYRQRTNIIYKLGLNDRPSLIDPYFKSSYPAVMFSGSGGKELDKQSAENFYNLIYSIAADSSWKIQSDLSWDKHYLVIFAGSRIIYIPEQTYILFLIILLSLILLYPFISTGRFNKYLKSILNHFWTIPVLFSMVFLFLFVSTYAVRSLLYLRNFQSLWKYAPILIIIFKLSLSSFLFLISLRLFRFFNFPHRGSFYSASSILFVLIDVLFVLAIDISFAFYLVPVLFSIFLFTVVKNRWIKLFFLLTTAVILIFAASKMFYSGSDRIVGIFILSPLYGNLLITANLLPVLLMIYRIRFLFHRRNSVLTKRIILTLDLSLGILSLSMYIYLALFSPFSRENPQPVNVTEVVEIGSGKGDFTLTSPAPLGSFSFTNNKVTASYNTKSRSMVIKTAELMPSPVVELKKYKFLNRSRYTLVYKYDRVPEALGISLISDSEIVVYDSNYPYESSEDSTRIDFKTGSVPNSYFILIFTLPEKANGELLITGKYGSTDSNISVSGRPFSIQRTLIFKKKILITNSD